VNNISLPNHIYTTPNNADTPVGQYVLFSLGALSFY